MGFDGGLMCDDGVSTRHSARVATVRCGEWHLPLGKFFIHHRRVTGWASVERISPYEALSLDMPLVSN